ncbi:MAG: regulatory protein RecX [Gemmatimonadota bacterium]|nr:regulatory protein RecX [Gemmatimonadota bacterium]
MPVVTRIEPRRGAGLLVEIDEERLRPVPRPVAEAFELRAGLELSPARTAALRAEVDRYAARDAALRLLARRPYARAELARRLGRRGLPPEAVEWALARCEALGYLDDSEFAVSYVRDRLRLRPRAPALLRDELRARGVDPATAAAAVEAGLAEAGIAEGDLLRRLATRRARALAGTPDREAARRRLAGWLRRRGFAPGDVRDAVDESLPPAPPRPD